MFNDSHPDLFADWTWTIARQEVAHGWRFDYLSFVIGLVVAFVLVALAWRYRAKIAQHWERLKKKANQLRRRLTADMATRYSANAIETAQTMHLFGTLAPLDQIYVETQLYASLASETSEAEPRLLSPQQAIQASDRLLITGRPGSGRTTLLNHLLLLQAGRLHAAEDDERVPVYVSLPVLASELTKDGARQDEPAQQLVQSAIVSISRSRVVAKGVARWLSDQVKAGNALVLLDGWDKVPAVERPAVMAWIQDLSAAHPGSCLVITAGERGCATLIKAGFVPLQPLAWTHRQLADLLQRWLKVWPSRNDSQVDPHLSFRLTPPTPLEATIELAIQLNGQTPADTPAGKMAQVMSLILPPPETDDKGNTAWPLRTGHRALGRLALAALEQGRSILKREEIQAIVAGAMPPPRFAPDATQDNALDKQDQKAAREEQDQRNLQVVDCCRALTVTGGPIQDWGNRRYLFTHPLVAAYLAANYLAAEADDNEVSSAVAHADEPAWLDVLRFYAGLTDAEPLVKRLLSTPDDLFMNHLWTAAALLASSPPGRAPWRVGLIKRLAQLLMTPRIPAGLRDRALLALINSGEPGVGLLFKQTTQQPDPILRSAATLGLGALRREQDLPLIEAGLGDADPDVRLAAVNALSLLAQDGNESATELIIAAMIETEDQVQQVAAETLAGLGSEGQAVLQDGAQDDDLLVRRAAVYGLAAVGEPWATELLDQMQREDTEWLVRNAAVQALSKLAAGDDQAAPLLELALPQAETESWLITWAAEQGEGTGMGEAALNTLVRALHEGEAPIRYRAVETLGRLAHPRTIDALRQSLRDPEPLVRQGAWAALDEISQRHDVTITTR